MSCIDRCTRTRPLMYTMNRMAIKAELNVQSASIITTMGQWNSSHNYSLLPNTRIKKLLSWKQLEKESNQEHISTEVLASSMLVLSHVYKPFTFKRQEHTHTRHTHATMYTHIHSSRFKKNMYEV